MSTSFKEKWLNQAVDKVLLVYPDDDVDEIRGFLSKKFDSDLSDKKCKIYNNYEKETIDTSIYKLMSWLDDTKPILTESGTLFRQHSETYNPDTEILNKKLAERKIEKKAMFNYLKKAEATDSQEEKLEYKYLAKKKDLAQVRIKVIVNSEYGVSGLSSSWFFNIACASATTARGQALISTVHNAFEDFLADNVAFLNMDECLTFVNNIINEKNEWLMSDSNWLTNVTKEELFDRLINKFNDKSVADEGMIHTIVSNLSQRIRNRVFYKSNLEQFIIRTPKARAILSNIAFTNVEFESADNIPSELAKDVKLLNKALLEFVHYKFPTINRTYRLKTQKRKRVITIDTDS